MEIPKTPASSPRPVAHCYRVITGKLLARDHPGTQYAASPREKLARLIDAGLTAFIDLTEPNAPARFGKPIEPCCPLFDGQSHERFAIRDMSTPRTDELTRQALDAIDTHLDEKETLYLRRRGGVGKTGTIISCWLHLITN